MKTFKNNKLMRKVTVAFAGTLLLTTVVSATSLTKKIDATFRGIKVYYNNQQKTMEQEPFIYNNSVYLPVRAVGELVNKEITWNSSTNSVFVADKGASSGDLTAELTSKNFEIARLTGEKDLLEKKVKELEAKLKTKEEDKVSGGDLAKTQAYIEKQFDYEHSIDWDFKLTETNSRINLEVSLDSRYDDNKWQKLNKSQRENFFREIVREIRRDFKDAQINGSVVDRRIDKSIGSFTYSTNNSFTYSDNSATSFTELENYLRKEVKKINGTTIPVDDIVIKGNEDNVTFTVYLDLYNRTLQNDWDYAMEMSSRDIRQTMEFIQVEVLRDFKHATVQGFIEDIDTGATLAKFDGRRLY